MIIKKKILNKHFQISKIKSLLKLLYPGARNPIYINPNFKLDIDCATLAGMMPDGSLIKDLKRIYFHQKKDYRKILLFKRLLLKLFRPKNRIFIRDNRGTTDIFTNSQTLAMFFYKILKIAKFK